jgi:DNA-binding XRE family transcriptional regulator
MNEPIKHQVIEKNGVPLFVLVPYEEYLQSCGTSDEGLYLPNEVVKAHAIDGKTLLKAWREFKGLTQKEMGNRMGVSQSAYSQIERSENPHENTIRKAALALRLDWRLLTLNESE